MIIIDSEFFRQCLPYARGEVPADLLIRNARVANVFSLEYELTDVAVAQGVIVGMGEGYTGTLTLDAAGKVLIPGMMDGHTHIESTMLTPARFAECAVPHGTSAVMADPHEIANVWGRAGLTAMWRNSQGLPMDFLWGASSCVPASDFETCREPLQARELETLFSEGVCGYLGEMMNYPAVIAGDETVWAKIGAAWVRPLNAHSPGVGGKDLCAYLLSGCDADHESVVYEEALEKLRRGGWVMMRAGSAANDLPQLVRLVLENPARAARCMVVSDDLSVEQLLGEGHMDARLRAMCELGVEPLAALRMLTLSPAEYFRLPRRGGIAPGWMADMALVDSLESCRVERVWKSGRLVAQDGKICDTLTGRFSCDEKSPMATISLSSIPDEAIAIKNDPAKNRIRVIGWQSGSLLTQSLVVEPTVREGMIVADPQRDIAKLVVRGRNRINDGVAVGFVKGLGLRRGALGSSVAYDAHPFVVAGADDQAILKVLEWLRQNGGGVVVHDGKRITASLPLLVAGLMSDEGALEVAERLVQVNRAAADIGIVGEHPCMALSFLTLSVIPSLKLTDQGYVDLCAGGRQAIIIE